MSRSNWWLRFVNAHAERLIFIGLATVFGVGFLVAGILADIGELKGAGITMLVQVGGIFLSRMRSPNPKMDEEIPIVEKPVEPVVK